MQPVSADKNSGNSSKINNTGIERISLFRHGAIEHYASGSKLRGIY